MRIYTLNTHLWKLNSNCKKTLFNETVEGSPINLSRVSEIQNCFSKSGLYFQSYLALVLYSKVQFFINSSLKLIAWDQFERSLKTYSVVPCGFFSLVVLFLSVGVLWHSVEFAFIVKETELNTNTCKKSWAVLTFTVTLKINK